MNIKLELTQEMMGVVSRGLRQLTIDEAFETVTEINRQGYEQIQAQQIATQDANEKAIQKRIDKALEKAGVKPDGESNV